MVQARHSLLKMLASTNMYCLTLLKHNRHSTAFVGSCRAQGWLQVLVHASGSIHIAM